MAAEVEASADVEVAMAAAEDVEAMVEEVTEAEVAATVRIFDSFSHQDLTLQEGGGGYDRQGGGGGYDRQGGGSESFLTAVSLSQGR